MQDISSMFLEVLVFYLYVFMVNNIREFGVFIAPLIKSYDWCVRTHQNSWAYWVIQQSYFHDGHYNTVTADQNTVSLVKGGRTNHKKNKFK